MAYDVIMTSHTKLVPRHSNYGNVLNPLAKFQGEMLTGNRVSKNDLWRHYDVRNTKFGHGIRILVTFYPPAKFQIQTPKENNVSKNCLWRHQYPIFAMEFKWW